MSYAHLGSIFPTVIMVKREEALEMIRDLLTRNDLPGGTSSFAVTADAPIGHCKLWLSYTSFKYLAQSTGLPAPVRDSLWQGSKRMELE